MQAFLASINWDSFGVPLGFLGGALAVGLACCGSARGVGMVGQAGAGLLSVDRDLWKQETEGIHEFYAKFGDKLPKALAEELAGLEERLKD